MLAGVRVGAGFHFLMLLRKLYLICLGRTLEGDELELRKANLEESEVPAEIEVILEELLSGLEDKVQRHPVYVPLRLSHHVCRTRSFATPLRREWPESLNTCPQASLTK